jgi:FixJ family two-component response regulator
VIIASGKPDGAASVEQFRTRIAAFVAKPFTLSELEGKIRLALES